MDYVRLGSIGLRVSRICLGAMSYGDPAWRAWVLSEDASRPFITRALERGINFFDTADMYSLGRSEEVLGRALRDFTKREQVVIATKVFNPMSDDPNDRGLSRKHILASIDASLRRLGTDYVDIYYLHHPDPDTPLDESIEALDDMRRAGKIRYAAASNISAWELAYWTSWSAHHDRARFACAQPRYNMLYRAIEAELVPACKALDVALVVYNPLAAGVLTGKYRAGDKPAEGRFAFKGASGERYRTRYYRDETLRVVQEAAEDVARRGKSMTHLAVRWTLDQPGITCAIVGASKAEQIEDSLKGVEVKLDDADRRLCDDLWYRLPRRRPQEED